MITMGSIKYGKKSFKKIKLSALKKLYQKKKKLGLPKNNMDLIIKIFIHKSDNSFNYQISSIPRITFVK